MSKKKKAEQPAAPEVDRIEAAAIPVDNPADVKPIEIDVKWEAPLNEVVLPDWQGAHTAACNEIHEIKARINKHRPLKIAYLEALRADGQITAEDNKTLNDMHAGKI
jgi:hypothetical protein